MSKKDRDRAERTGMIFRGGKLVPKKKVRREAPKEQPAPEERPAETSFDDLRRKLREG